jgi:DNA modification methylase
LFEINRKIQKDVGNNHTCPKQMDLMIDLLDSYAGKSVADLFLGSGTTLIAAEKLKRKCYGMELDEKYCDVIINRWGQFTGQKANKING